MGDVLVRNDHAVNLPPVQLSQDLKDSLDKVKVDSEPTTANGPQQAPNDEDSELVTVDEKQIETVLNVLFSLGAMYYGDAENWDPEEFKTDLEYLKPLGEAWANKRQWAAKLVTAAEEESFPIVMGYTFGKRIKASEAKKKADKSQQAGNPPIVPVLPTGGRANARNEPLNFG